VLEMASKRQADRETLELFRRNAEAAAVRVVEVATFREAALFAVRLAGEKPAAPLLIPGLERPEGAGKTLFFSGLPERLFGEVSAAALQAGARAARSGARAYAGALDVGFSVAALGIAETASLVLAHRDEDSRLASMLPETHVAALAASSMVTALEEAAPFIERSLALPGSWTTLVSGCSRTSDIERVLVLGVHGPLELCVCLVMDEEDIGEAADAGTGEAAGAAAGKAHGTAAGKAAGEARDTEGGRHG
jgi:L-lactate dehydrogenase complex protein LldG